MRVFALILIASLITVFALSFGVVPDMTSDTSPYLKKLATSPQLIKHHTDLAKIYLKQKQMTKATFELDLAHDLLQIYKTEDRQILGESTLSDIESTQTELVQKTQLKRAYWETVAQRYPHYRDAWVELAFLAYSQNDDAARRQYISRIIELDPNYLLLLPYEIRGNTD